MSTHLIPKFRRIQAGQYASTDGRYLIEQQPYTRECDCVVCRGGWGECRSDGWVDEWYWIIWDVARNDYAEGTMLSSFETLREAKEWFAADAALYAALGAREMTDG